MSFPGAGSADQAGTSAGSARDRQAGGCHRFSQFTIPAARPLLDAARVTAGSTVLHAGAGPGYTARAAQVRGARAVAADLPAAMLACARHADPLLPLTRADAGTRPVDGGAFTAVVTGCCLPHMADPAAGTAELARALAPAGGSPSASASATQSAAPCGGSTRAQRPALWDGLLASPAAAVLRAIPAIQRRIRKRFLTLAAALTDPGGTMRLPVGAVIAAAKRPLPAARGGPPGTGPPRRVPAGLFPPP